MKLELVTSVWPAQSKDQQTWRVMSWDRHSEIWRRQEIMRWPQEMLKYTGNFKLID